MRTSAVRASVDEQIFSAEEIARAAGVPAATVVRLLRNGQVGARRDFVGRADAVRLVRQLGAAPTGPRRAPLGLIPEKRRRQGLPLAVSAAVHAAFVGALILVTTGLFQARETEQLIINPRPVRLVYFMTPGPGGGGGGGGLKVAVPPARIERHAAPKVHKVNSPVPPIRKPAAVDPPKPVDPPKIDPPRPEPPRIDPPKPEPPKVDPPKPAAQSVQAPVAPSPTDAANRPGVLNQPPSPVASPGPGTGGGSGTGAGTGVGSGRGSGIGPGTDAGIGGGPYRPGAGIEPPSLLREVKPLYTDDARKRSIEGNVVLEVIVRRDGSVGAVRVTRSLDAGLNEKAIEAVRQWRFAPARRLGAPVDVIAEISVEFKLR